MTKPNKERELLRELLPILRALTSPGATRNKVSELRQDHLWAMPPETCRAWLIDYAHQKIAMHLGDGFDETRQQLEELGKASGGSHRQGIDRPINYKAIEG